LRSAALFFPARKQILDSHRIKPLKAKVERGSWFDDALRRLSEDDSRSSRIESVDPRRFEPERGRIEEPLLED